MKKIIEKYESLVGYYSFLHLKIAIKLGEIKDYFDLQEWLIPNVYENWTYYTEDPEDEYQEECAFLEENAECFFNYVKGI
jgi:hypothetical protein